MAAKTFDVCIIGSGIGGGTMAEELTRAGMSVVMLERGPQLGAGEFMEHDELSNIIRNRAFSPRLKETVRESSTEKAVTRPYSMLAHCVGGSAVRWGSWAWRFRPDDFRVLSMEGSVAGAALADWPVQAEEMAPFYAKAEAAYGVAGAAVHNALRSGHAYPNPPHPYRSGSLVLEKGMRKLGYHPFPIPMAINSRPYHGRAACTNSGMCAMFGCAPGAKASPLVVQIPRALATRKLDLRANCRVYELALDAAGKLEAARYYDDKGERQEVRARQFILAAGAIGSAQLLLLSRSGKFPLGLANSSGLVGRHLMFHTLAWVNFDMDDPSRGAIGPPGMIAMDDLHDSDAKRGFVRGAVIGEGPTATPLGMALQAEAYLGSGDRAWGQALKNYIKRFPYVHGMIAIGEDLPVHENRIDLDPTEVDDLGIAVPRLTHAYHANDLKLRDYYEQRMLEIANASGSKKSWRIDMTRNATGHIMGTCRMGKDPHASVIDRWCRSHDVANLWVVDGSFFPTSGGYNPTLTILANSYRVAAHFIAEAKRLNLK